MTILISQKHLWKFEYTTDYGNLYGLFLASEEEMTLLFGSKAVVDFGEALGKHSRVILNLGLTNFECLTWSKDTLSIANRIALEIGYNPIDYYISPHLDIVRWFKSEEKLDVYLIDNKITHLKEYLLSQYTKFW